MTKAKEEFSSSSKDGVFVSRKLRRDADATVKVEIKENEVAAEAAADAADRAAYEAEVGWAEKTEAEKTHLRERALFLAMEEARANNGLPTEADKKEEAAKAQAAAAKKADAAAKKT